MKRANSWNCGTSSNSGWTATVPPSFDENERMRDHTIKVRHYRSPDLRGRAGFKISGWRTRALEILKLP
jgi:hypothetical protein